ncbi:unnamed protein product [Heterotrigona itama]|uniref:Uncharacterized protein n=1 Tax=Heterotrigona itama TaxID=395501 RepID=A0A6V7HG03_9HYME|nr:unnamed protein product [Heterotrigona itama]
MGVHGLLPDSHLPVLLGNKEQTVASDSEGSHLWEPSCTMPCSLDHEKPGRKRVDGNEDDKIEHPSFGTVSTSFSAAFILHLILELPSRIS